MGKIFLSITNFLKAQIAVFHLRQPKTLTVKEMEIHEVIQRNVKELEFHEVSHSEKLKTIIVQVCGTLSSIA